MARNEMMASTPRAFSKSTLCVRNGSAVGMLGIERQGDPERAVGPARARARARPRRAYFSTPLITIPRVKNRWKTRKIRTGMIIVINVPAWMNAWFR